MIRPKTAAAVARYLAAALAVLSLQFLLAPAAMAAHTSVTCVAKSGTVSSGGTVTIDVTDCTDGIIGLARSGSVDGPALPAHGTATLRIVGNQWLVDYHHNGDGATSDAFEFSDVYRDPDFSTVRVTITITPAPAVSIAVSPATVSEDGATNLTYTVTRSFALASPTTVNITTTGTATAGTDYTGNVASVAIPAGATTATVIANPTGDGTVEPDETVTMTVAAGTGYTVGAPSSATGTILNDDLPNLVINDVTVSEGNAGTTNASFTVSLSQPAGPGGVSFDIATADGSAAAGTDYVARALSGQTIPAGSSTYSFTVALNGDALNEPSETFFVNVTNVTNAVVVDGQGVGTIVNDDPLPSLSVNDVTVAEGNAGTTNAVFTVTLSAPSGQTVAVNYATADGTATQPADYTSTSGVLTFTPGETVKTVTVPVIGDAFIEPNETFFLNISGATNATISDNQGVGTISNDDLPNLVINDVTVNEGNAGTTNATFTVSLSQPAGPGGVSFDIATADGSAAAGVDYVARALSGQTIPAGSSTYSFTVALNGDALNEPSETFFVNVTNVTNAVVVDGQGVGTIVNDDPLPSLSVNDVTVAEGNAGTTNAVFTVTLSAPSGQTVAVNYATADGTATQPADYTSTSGALTFTPGQTVKTVTVPVIGDATPEANETFFLNFSGASNATISDNQGVGTISNDDVPVVISPASLPTGTVGAAYSQVFTASGGSAPYSYAVTAGALPAGLSLAGGTLSGTPTAGGTFNFTVTATDNSPSPGPFSGSRAYTLVINAPTIELPATTLAAGTLGAAYSGGITPATGGTAPYSYHVSAGVLPTGLSINPSTGAITGAPSTIGTVNFSITATDSSTGTGPYTATRGYTITVNDSAPVADSSYLSVSYNAAATNVPLSFSGGAPTSLAIATAPSHGTAIASGTTITYEPSPGFYGEDSFTYTATNSGGTSAPATVTVDVKPPFVEITAFGCCSTTVGRVYD